jgi:hypothetical protein
VILTSSAVLSKDTVLMKMQFHRILIFGAEHLGSEASAKGSKILSLQSENRWIVEKKPITAENCNNAFKFLKIDKACKMSGEDLEEYLKNFNVFYKNKQIPFFYILN